MNNKDNEAGYTGATVGLRGRLFAGFGTLLAILLVVTAVVLFKISETRAIADRVIEITLPAYENYHDLSQNVQLIQALHRTWVTTHDAETKSELTKTLNIIDKLESQMNQDANKWNGEESRKWNDVNALLTKFQSMISISMNDPAASTTELKTVMNDLLSMLKGSEYNSQITHGGILTSYFDALNKGALAIVNDMDALQYMEYVLLVIVIISSLIISAYTSRSILKYINIFRTQSKRVASGDLTQRVSVKSQDEMGMLGEDLNAMTEGLATITRQISEACHHMVSMLAEVKHAVDSQSAGASEQASSINQITASLEEIEKSSTQTIEKAKALGEVAERTRAKGQLGLEAVEQSMNGMKVIREKVQTISQTILELSNQTQQVGEITSVVNMLAQQSKMLALNASIEAAKAGEAGKGFAVVAAEVKNLAEQSEQSTTQVQKILEDIHHATEKAVLAMEEGTKGVDIGSGLVEQTGEIVRSLSEVIHEATLASQQIEAAIRQEGIGIEQITAGMSEINQVTSSSVEGVRQTTEAIDNLGNIANTLKKYTDTYKV